MTTANAPQPNIGSEDRRDGRRAPRAARFRLYAVIAPLLLLLVLWTYLFFQEGAFKGGPGGRAFGGDYTMFVSAAQILRSGSDPYNPAVLVRTETAMLQRLHRPAIKAKERAQVRVGNPPLLYWAIRPLVDADFVPAAYASLFGLYLLSALGFLAILRYLGWKSRVVPLLIFLLMPQVVLGAFYGNVIGLVFAALGGALLLSERYPLLAGALMTLAWLKPPVALPIVLLLGLFHVRHRIAYWAAFGVATLGLLGLTVATTGVHSLGLWIHGLLRYSNDVAIQPDLISLAGLYVRWMPAPGRLALEGLTLAAALAATWIALRRAPSGGMSLLAAAPLWVMWLLAAPYGHFFDEVLLAIPMAAFAGRDGCRITFRPAATALYLLFLSLFLISWMPGGVHLLAVPLVFVAILILQSRTDPRFQPA